VILEEYRRKLDDPPGVLYDELYEQSYQAGPYRRSVIGTFDSISNTTRDSMFDYYQRYYTPDNMVLIVIGDVQWNEVGPQIDRAFEKFSRRRNPLPDANPETKYRKCITKTMQMDVNMAYMAMAFPAASITQQSDVFALDVASTILCDGRSSRAYRRLREELRLVYSISGGAPTHRRESLFYVMATLEPVNVPAAKDEIVSVFRRLSEQPPSAQELAKAQRVLRNGFLFSTETNTGQSGTIGYYYTVTGGTEFYENYLTNLSKVTAEDVARVAEKYFSSEPCTVIVEPETDSSPDGKQN